MQLRVSASALSFALLTKWNVWLNELKYLQCVGGRTWPDVEFAVSDSGDTLCIGKQVGDDLIKIIHRIHQCKRPL